MRLFATIASALLLAGCVATGVRVDETNLKTFEKGKTTYAEVIAKLGSPTTNTLLPDGKRMLMYTWVQAQARPQNFIPLVGAFVGGADSRSSNVIITFNAQGVLESYSATQSQFGIGRGLEAASGGGGVPDQPRSQVGQ